MSNSKQKKRKFLRSIETAVLALLAISSPFAATIDASQINESTPVIQTMESKTSNFSVIGEPLLIKRSGAHFSTASHYSHSSHSSHSSHYSSSY